MEKRRIALVVDQERQASKWLAGFDTVVVERGRYLAAELAAMAPDLIVMETVHPSEAGWLMSWVRSQPRLSLLPLVMILPFGPAPRGARGVGFVECPLDKDAFLAAVQRLLAAAQTTNAGVRPRR